LNDLDEAEYRKEYNVEVDGEIVGEEPYKVGV